MTPTARRVARTLLLAALGCLGTLDRVDAGVVVPLGIIVDDTVLVPVEDPFFQYNFYLSLAPKTELDAGDFITFDDLPNFAAPTTRDPNPTFSSGASGYFTISTSAGTKANTSETTYTNVKLLFTSDISLVNNKAISKTLGVLAVRTSYVYGGPNDIPAPLKDPVLYTSTTHSSTTRAGQTGIGITSEPRLVATPEPAGLAFAAFGLTLASLMAIRLRGSSPGKDAAAPARELP